MGGQILNGALASHISLDEESEHGEHGKTAVLDLLHLQELKGVGVLGKAKGIEGAARVQLVKILHRKSNTRRMQNSKLELSQARYVF